MPLKTSRVQPLVYLFFFGSGFAALLYQVVWLKYLNLLIGNTTYATAAVLSAFMFGLSLGSWLASRWQALYRTPLRSYGIVEMGVGIFAMIFPSIYTAMKIPFGVVFGMVGPQTLLYNLVAFVLSFVVLVIPTSLMGASLPLLSEYLVRKESVAKQTGYLYGLNTVGAVAGIILGAFLFIPLLGLHATIYIGVIINLFIGLVCFLAGKKSDAPIEEESSPGYARDWLLYLYALSGLLALAYEVLWTRILVLHLGSSVYAYAIMLSVFLLGISLGSYVSGRWISTDSTRSARLFGWIQIAWAFSILIQLLQFTHLSNVLYDILSSFNRITITAQFMALFAATFQILFLPTLLSGMLFPLMVTRMYATGITIKKATSLTYSFNTVGGIFGSLLAGFILLPVFGTQTSLLILAATNMILGLLAFQSSPAQQSRPALAVLLLIFSLFGAGGILAEKKLNILRSAGIFQMEGKEQLLSLEEDVSATISVEKRLHLDEPYLSISVNGVNVAGTAPNLVAIQKLQGHIPMILYGPAKPKKVLHIGFGSGGTAYSVSLYPKTAITVVELSRSIVRHANQYFPSVNFGIVESGTLRFVYFDGRSYLENTQERFDVILSDSVHPRYAGNGSLYTKDYYELVYKNLNQGGVHSQWIPLYSLTSKNFNEILKAFYDVFPETYIWYVNSTINPYVIVTVVKGTSGISFHSITEALALPEVREDLKRVGVLNPYFLLDYFLFGKNKLRSLVAEVEPHTDDRMTVEYESSRVIRRDLSWLQNFEEILAFRESVQGYLNPNGGFDQAAYQQFYEATLFNLNGQKYFLQKKWQDAQQQFQAARSRNTMDTDPFESKAVANR